MKHYILYQGNQNDVYSISKLNNLKNINSINEGQALKIYGDLKMKPKIIIEVMLIRANIKKMTLKKIT